MVVENGIKYGQLAKDELEGVNAAGGVNGKKIEVILLDDECKPDKGIANVNRFIHQHKVHLVLGSTCSSVSLPMLDEPSAALAPQVVLDIFRTIHRISRDGMTVLLVEQNVRMALLLAQYGYVIRDGIIHIEGPADQLLHDDNVRLAYLGGTVANREATLRR